LSIFECKEWRDQLAAGDDSFARASGDRQTWCTNGRVKINERYLSILYDLVGGSPLDLGYLRPTWTQELLSKVMMKLTGVKVHRSTMYRALAAIDATLNRRKATPNA